MISKHKGFASFQRKINRLDTGITTLCSFEEMEEVSGVSVPQIKRVLKGDTYSLLRAFTWDTTPQGKFNSNYWVAKYSGTKLLSEDDITFMKELVELHS